MSTRSFGAALLLPLFWAPGASANAALLGDATAPLPLPANHTVDFAREIKPIFEASCIRCHARGRNQGGFSIETRPTLLVGGDDGPVVEIGKSADSYLIELVAGADPDLVMPEKGSRLTAQQVGLLRAWIDQGLKWDKGVDFTRPPPNNMVARRPEVPPGSPELNPVDRFLRPYFAARRIGAAKAVSDRLFARRAFLDAIGLLPSPEQLSDFLADRDPEKRAKLVRRLLADSPNYAQNWMGFWNDLLRNDYKGAGQRTQVTAWLYKALATSLPYDRLVAALIDPTPETAGFTDGIVWRGVINASQTPAMQAAQNISQVFLGVNLKCASCHDSFVNDLTLADSYGMAGIYAAGPLEMVRCDIPTGKTVPMKFLYPQLGQIDPNADKASRLRRFAEIVTQRSDGRLTRTIVNRYWARLMGHGLVGDVDDMEQISWNPDLLDWLAEDFADHGYDLRHLIERIMTSRAYQMPAVPVDENAGGPFVFRGPLARRMTAEQYLDAIGQVTGAWYERPDAKVDFSAGAAQGADCAPPAVRRIWGGSGSAAAAPLVFRKIFVVGDTLESSFLLIGAPSSCDLDINGTVIGQKRLERFGPYEILDLQGLLRAGRNCLLIRIAGTAQEKPAGIVAYVQAASSLPDFAGAEYMATDASWQWTEANGRSWDELGRSEGGWRQASDLGGIERGAAGGDLEMAIAAASQFGRARGSMVEPTSLQIMMGCPARDQVTTNRPSAATTLEALAFSNGRELADRLKRGARDLIDVDGTDPHKLVRRVYLGALGRAPNRAELKLACDSLGRPAQPEALEDLIWAVTMLPEFQIIY